MFLKVRRPSGRHARYANQTEIATIEYESNPPYPVMIDRHGESWSTDDDQTEALVNPIVGTVAAEAGTVKLDLCFGETHFRNEYTPDRDINVRRTPLLGWQVHAGGEVRPLFVDREEGLWFNTDDAILFPSGIIQEGGRIFQRAESESVDDLVARWRKHAIQRWRCKQAPQLSEPDLVG